MDYPAAKADSLERYVRKSIPLSRLARHVYASLRWLEYERPGFCKPICVGHRGLASEAAIDVKSVKPALLELQTRGLCEVTIGRPIKADKKATIIRRKTLDEIKAQSTEGNDDAHRLARVLSRTSFLFCGQSIAPSWTVGLTGRVSSSRPNFQGKPSNERVEGLVAGLGQGLCLVHADIRQAEPTIIKHLLGVSRERDLYQEYMTAVGCPRAAAKKAVNTLAYCKNTKACFGHWPSPAQVAVGDYVLRLDAHKAQLFAETKRTRSVTTLTGRCMRAENGRRLHAGMPMNWRVQGTVADIVNGACLRLLESARLVLPVHDAVYAIVTSEGVAGVEAALVDSARGFGLAIEVTTEVFDAH